jgi:hypothetical protein
LRCGGRGGYTPQQRKVTSAASEESDLCVLGMTYVC